MSKHDLENMIFNLEERKYLKKVEFTQKAVIEVLGYLKELQKLKEEVADAEEHIDNLELQLREQYQLVDEKDEEIELLEKALKLACAKLLSIYCSDYCGETSNCEKINCEYAKRSSQYFFKTKAKEIINESKS